MHRCGNDTALGIFFTDRVNVKSFVEGLYDSPADVLVEVQILQQGKEQQNDLLKILQGLIPA
jgi:hypothetical protein